MSTTKAPTPGELNRQQQSMEKELRAYVDAQLDGVMGSARVDQRRYRAIAARGRAPKSGAWLLVLLLVSLFAMVAWLGWGISVLSGQVEELGGRVESLTLEVERLRGAEPEAVTPPEGDEEPAAVIEEPADPAVETPSS